MSRGFKPRQDFAGPGHAGVGALPMNIAGGIRRNTGIAYLRSDVRARANLSIRGDAVVDKVLFEGTRATGVALADGTVLPAGEVVLSAGTYGSAAILLRSGMGPAGDLERLGVPIVADLPVGSTLTDHPNLNAAFAARPERLGAQTPMIAVLLVLSSSLAAPGETDMHVAPNHFPVEGSPTGANIVIGFGLVRPSSRGRLWLDSTDPLASPRIDLNLLGTREDQARMVEGLRLARALSQTGSLRDLVVSEMLPGPQAETDEQMLQAVLAVTGTYYHPTSTAPMGPDADHDAVVDLRCAVRGTDGLRVVDASVLPDVTSAATNLTVLAFAEHIARTYAA